MPLLSSRTQFVPQDNYFAQQHAHLPSCPNRQLLQLIRGTWTDAYSLQGSCKGTQNDFRIGSAVVLADCLQNCPKELISPVAVDDERDAFDCSQASDPGKHLPFSPKVHSPSKSHLLPLELPQEVPVFQQ